MNLWGIKIMNKIVFAYTEESSRSRYLIDILKGEFDLIITRNCDEITDVIHNKFDTIEALIIDHPADKSDIDRLIKYVERNNNFLFNLPIIILSELSMMEDDDKYLSDVVVGMIVEGESKRTVLQRIKNTIRFANSASFDEFARMLKVLPSLIYVKDVKGRYAFCSHRWHHLQNPDESIRGLTDFEVRKNADNAKIAQENDRKVVESGKGISYVIKENDEEGLEYLQIIKEPLKDKQGRVNGIIAIINNVTEEELLKQDLRHKSITDQLTGLYNRVYFEEMKGKYENKMSYPVTFISADCDGLKKINDKYGHASGDEYICLARDALKESLPEKSYLFRMGGDEFVAIVPGMKTYDGNLLVKKIVKNSSKYKNNKFQLRLSVGSHTLSKMGTSIEGALALSDKAMYKMKKERLAKHK